MTALKSEEVKNAIASALMRIAPGTAVYKEAVTLPEYPHFFVHLLEVSDDEDRRGRHHLRYSFDLRYRVRSDPSTDIRLEQDIDAAALALMVGLNVIPCGDEKIRIEDKRYEKVDGVLHFFCSVTMQVMLKDTEAETVKQGKLDVEIELEVKR